MFNDTELEPIFWELNLSNTLFNFCVGVWVGGHPRANFLHGSKDVQENCTFINSSPNKKLNHGLK